MRELLDQGRVSLLEQGYWRHGGTVEVILGPQVSAQQFEELLRRSSGRRDATHMIVRSAGLGVGLAVGGTVLLVLAAIDLFSSLFGELLSAFTVGDAWRFALLMASFVLGAAALSFAPQLLSGDGGWIRSFVSRWVNSDARAHSRTRRRLKSVSGRDGIRRVIVWNAMDGGSVGLPGLVSCFDGVRIEVELRIHQDELDAVFDSWPSWSIPPQLDGTENESPVVLVGGTVADPVMAVDRIAGPHASRAYSTAVMSSSLRATPVWRAGLDESGAFANELVSANLAAYRFDSDVAFFANQGPTLNGRSWVQRLVTDYGLLSYGSTEGALEFGPYFPEGDPLADHGDLVAAFESRHKPAETLPPALACDVTAVLVSLLGTNPADWSLPELRERINRYVHLAQERELYRGIQAIAPIIEAESTMAAGERRLLPRLDMDSLQLLANLLSVTGPSSLAIWLARWIAPYTGLSGAIERAFILERAGNTEAAIAELEGIGVALQPALFRLETEGVMTLSAQECDVVRQFSCACAWVILSRGIDDEQWGKKSARSHLVRAEGLLQHPTAPVDPNDARQLANYWGLLLEWEGDLAAAIERHRHAAELPGIRLRRVLGSTINMGRAQRDLVVTRCLSGEPFSSEDFDAVMLGLAGSAVVIRRGYEGKLEIGDVDEAPIGAHNLALAEICQALVAHACGGDSAEYARAALQAARDGLALLDGTRSTRKRDMLTEEARFAARLVRQASGEQQTDRLPEETAQQQTLSDSDQSSIDSLLQLAELVGWVDDDHVR